MNIESVFEVQLTKSEEEVFRNLFPTYTQVFIKAEFGAGFSESRVFLLRPFNAENAAEAACVVKIGPKGVVERELKAFQNIIQHNAFNTAKVIDCLLYTSPSPRDKRQSRMPSSA